MEIFLLEQILFTESIWLDSVNIAAVIILDTLYTYLNDFIANNSS